MSSILVSGLPGVGKSTTLAAVQALRPELLVLSVGSVIREQAEERGLVGDVREHLTATVTADVVNDAKNQIVRRVRENGGGLVLIDSHTATVGEFSVRLTPDTTPYLEAIDLVGIIMLRAPIETINERRQGDYCNRRLGAEVELSALETVTISSLVSISTSMNCPLHLVSAIGSLDSVAERVLRAVDDVLAWR